MVSRRCSLNVLAKQMETVGHNQEEQLEPKCKNVRVNSTKCAKAKIKIKYNNINVVWKTTFSEKNSVAAQ